MRRRAWMALVWLALATPARAEFPDTLAVWRPLTEGSQFDRVDRSDYIRRHAVSLDQFLEFTPGGVVVRRGPIGFDASYSRWGIGPGRAALTLNSIPFNNPQTGVAPWVHVATSGLGRLDYETGTRGLGWIEGRVALTDAPPTEARPATFIELSNGTNKLRQRRVKFGSEDGPLGVDLSYDEVLDDGYYFDASMATPGDADFGRARSRNSAIALRGRPETGADYGMGIRRYESSTNGAIGNELQDSFSDGYLAWLHAGVDAARVTVYGRGFSTSDPDSSADNAAVGVMFMTQTGAQQRVFLRLRGEQLNAAIDAHAVKVSRRLLVGEATAGAAFGIAGGAELFVEGGATGDDQSDLVWNATVGARLAGARNALGVRAGRSGRLPTLAQRYMPAYDAGAYVIASNPGVDPETAFEAQVQWEWRTRFFANRVRYSWIASDGTIRYLPYDVGGDRWRIPLNDEERRTLSVVEDRLHLEFGMGPLRTLAEGGVAIATGDRVAMFAGVPRVQVNASLLFGGEMFERTSALYAGAEYLHMQTRIDERGALLPAFDVVNLVVVGRLLDAQLYAKYLNLLDERYTTTGDYLMTPRSLCYGVEWTLFN